MELQDVINLPSMKEFYTLRDALNLSDRQREIFYLKYSRLWRDVDIAEELGIHQDTVSAEKKIIREKLSKFSLDKLSKED